MSFSLSHDLSASFSFPTARERNQPERWPRIPCFAAALLVSSGIWAGIGSLLAQLIF